MLKQIVCNKVSNRALLILQNRQSSRGCLPIDRKDVPCVHKVRIALVGLGGVGRSLAHLIKNRPRFMSELRLLNRSDPAGMVEELSQLPTDMSVCGFCGMENLCKGLEGADIVVITAGVTRKKDMPREAVFKENAQICATVCQACSQACPEALITIVSNPIDTLVPLAAEVLKKCGSYDPTKLFGICKLDQLRARHYFAELIGTNPKKTYVPVVGGHAENTTVPLFSRCRPNVSLTAEETKKLVQSVRDAGKKVVQLKKTSTTYGMASAAMQFLEKLSRGLRHEPNIVTSAYVESCVTPARFFSNEIVVGPGGLHKNLGFGTVNEIEKKMIDDAVKVLQKQIKAAEESAKSLKL